MCQDTNGVKGETPSAAPLQTTVSADMNKPLTEIERLRLHVWSGFAQPCSSTLLDEIDKIRDAAWNEAIQAAEDVATKSYYYLLNRAQNNGNKMTADAHMAAGAQHVALGIAILKIVSGCQDEEADLPADQISQQSEGET